MNVLRKHHVSALAVVAGSAILAIAALSGAAAQVPAPTLTTPASPEKAPGADGFIQRWILLEPIGASGLISGTAITICLRPRAGQVGGTQ